MLIRLYRALTNIPEAFLICRYQKQQQVSKTTGQNSKVYLPDSYSIIHDWFKETQIKIHGLKENKVFILSTPVLHQNLQTTVCLDRLISNHCLTQFELRITVLKYVTWLGIKFLARFSFFSSLYARNVPNNK